ncbi:unnamed protein product [Adineta ricciae]|uniref:Uncharacterized protein n=1 Tax=Adineta ricciae TaxID=249248 RepID=A0A815FUD9_ADIRI|nr:unnamed protein product [Adineta ricciae]
MTLSWDATGDIVMKREKQNYYYESTTTNLIKGGPSLSITSTLSKSHGTMDIIQWMNCFIEKYKQVYGYSEQFSKPPIIHPDCALVFLSAGIQIFNRNETMNRYIARCWRIIHHTASKQDLEITIVHACLDHFMKNVKKNASKHLNKKQVPFGMWLMPLLFNSSTLDEMIIVWRNICILLLSVNQNDHFKISSSVLPTQDDRSWKQYSANFRREPAGYSYFPRWKPREKTRNPTKGTGSDRRNTASMKSPEGPGTGRFRAGLFDLGSDAAIQLVSNVINEFSKAIGLTMVISICLSMI